VKVNLLYGSAVQVIRNLTSNAIKFTASGGSVTIRCEIVAKNEAGVNSGGAKRDQKILKVSVTDTGAGISKVSG